MCDQQFKDISHIFKCLESSSSAVVYKGLQDVRNRALKSASDVQMFKDHNGIKFLLRFVRKPNEKILDISLSILANLCVEDSVKTQVGEENGLIAHLLNLIANMQRDSIVGRTCRLIGNLATNQAVALKLHHKGAVTKLTDTIKSKDTSAATKHMAVRALRLLWEVENCRSNMLKDQAVRIVASLLVSKEDELLQAVLKALAKFTHCCNERCALQVQGDGKGFEELIASMKFCSKSELGVGVLLNLCLVPEVRPLLGTAGAVEAIISQCNGLEPQQFSADVVSVLCLLCRESVNRGKVRRGGGLELLLAILRCDAHLSLEARVLNAILHFIYDELGLQLLIKEGLVPVLIQKLNKVVEGHGDNHTKQSSEKKTSKNCSELSHQHKRLRLSSSREMSPSQWTLSSTDCDPLGLRSRDATPSLMQSGHWSPGSCRSMELSPDTFRAYSPPPSSSRCTPSPTIVSPLSPASPLSDAYSPVCGYSSSDEDKQGSDEEGVVEIEVDSDGEATSPCLNDKEDMQDIQEALSATLSSNTTSRHGVLESWCLLLLSRVSHMDALVEDMVSTSTVDTLLQYYALVEPPHPRAARVLQRLTRNHHCLLPLLRAGFVLKVNARLTERIHEECSRCSDLDSLGKALLSQLSVLAESGFGEGEIYHQLLRATRQIQTRLVLSVPFIIRSKRLLNVMMKCDQSGLDLLLQLISDVCEDGLVDEAVESISRLAHHIGVHSQSKYNAQLRESCDCRIEKCKQDSVCELIILELDDGVSVCGNREEICRESPVFSAMLTGGFRESGRERVPLKDVTEKTLSTLLTLVSQGGCCQCLLNRSDTNSAFEVLKLADRFIMQRIVNQVAEWLLEQLAPDIAPMLYIRAQDLRHVLSMSEKISRETLKFTLCTQIEKKKRFVMFSTILNSDYKQQFVDDVNNLIKSHMDRK